jgi:hypothetical protein
MKSKDVMYMLLAVVILMVAGYLAYTQLAPKKSAGQQGATVEVVGPISADFDSVAMADLTNPDKARDFSVPIDLSNGLSNQAIFGQ